jgi:hypothetical protein
VITAFLGFNSLTGNEGVVPTLPNQVVEAPVNEPSPSASATAAAVAEAQIDVAVAGLTDGLSTISKAVAYVRAAATSIGWDGLDYTGSPVGFSSNSGAYTQRAVDESSYLQIDSANSVFSASQNGVTVHLNQEISLIGNQASLTFTPVIQTDTGLEILQVTRQSSVETRLADGSRLITAWVTIVPAGANVAMPSQINVKLVLSADGSTVISEAAQLDFQTKYGKASS